MISIWLSELNMALPLSHALAKPEMKALDVPQAGPWLSPSACNSQSPEAA